MKFATAISTLALGAATFAGHALAQTAPAEEEAAPARPSVSASFAFTNDYVFRGISQTFGRVAVQGSFDLTHTVAKVPVYVGAWARSAPNSSMTSTMIGSSAPARAPQESTKIRLPNRRRSNSAAMGERIAFMLQANRTACGSADMVASAAGMQRGEQGEKAPRGFLVERDLAFKALAQGGSALIV